MMGGPFLSRHFLGEASTSATLIPFAPPGAADAEGVSSTHNLIGIGAWNEDAKEYHLSVVDLVVAHCREEVARAPALTRLAAFEHPGRPGCIKAAALDGGQVLVLTGSAGGHLSRLRMTVPLLPGAGPEAIQLCSEDFRDAELLPWLEAHDGAVAGLDISPERVQVLSASADGSLAVNGLDAAASAAPIFSSRGALSFTCARWAAPSSALTGSTQGVLQAWDVRQGGRPAQQLAPPPPQPVPDPVTCIDVHPGQPHVCVSGTLGGVLVLWDLRVPAAPLATAHAGAAVHDVRYSTAPGPSPPLLYCTDAGVLGSAGTEGAILRLTELYREHSAAVSALCIGGSGGPRPELFATTDQEGLVFLANAF